MAKNKALAARNKFYGNDTSRVGIITRFLWWCSGTLTDILEECPTEKATYQGIGAAVVFTAILASLTGGYALFFVFDRADYSVLFGILWGLLIFNLDRYIVTNINRIGMFWKQLWTTVPRVLLAVSIAFIISKPLQLKIFEKEINHQLEENYAEAIAKQNAAIAKQDKILTARYLEPVQSKIRGIEDEIQNKMNIIDSLNKELIREIQGATGKRGYGPIARQIENYLSDSKSDLKTLNTQLSPLKRQEESLKIKKDSELKVKYKARKVQKTEGLLSRLSALEELKKNNKTAWWADFFIFFLFLFIEVAPVFVKIFSPKGIYDELEARAAILEKEEVLENMNKHYR
ncbi:DUF4407 [Desulfonema magnum]|uniref:DUF4407 n=2 Tax=Desulfonema magnum TaxID=45655 RepID=A0A975GKA7_9BACT|nr:DUF4407 [Desulfonema magnum]